MWRLEHCPTRGGSGSHWPAELGVIGQANNQRSRRRRRGRMKHRGTLNRVDAQRTFSPREVAVVSRGIGPDSDAEIHQDVFTV